MKRAISIVLIIATMITLFAGLGIQSNAAENAVAKNALDNLMKQTGFREGDFGDNCKVHAKNVSKKLYGVDLPSNCAYPKKYKWASSSNWLEIKSLNGSNVTYDSLSNLFAQAKPGDMLQMYWMSTEHTAVVYSSNSSSVEFYQAGKGFYSKIVLSKYLVSDLVKRYNASSAHGITLYRYSKYDTKFPVQPYFESTQVLQKTYDKIQVKFIVKNPIKTKIIKFRTQIRKKGESSWHNFDKAISFTKGFYATRTFAANAGYKYSINDGTTYEIRGIASSSSKSYYSSIKQVTTPARINIGSASVSASNVKFTGSNIATSSLIKLSYNGSKLTKGTDFKFSKDSVKNIGKHTITITGLGKFKGSRKVTITVYPKTPTLNSLSYSKLTGRISLKWARVADCTKQQIAISTSSGFSSSNTGLITVDQSKQSGSIYNYKVNGKQLHVVKGKTYYIKMRAYKTVNGEKIYGKWSTAKSIKCK